jgi:hypothetical protein
MVKARVMKTSPNDVSGVVRAIGESLFPTSIIIVLMIIIYEKVDYMYGTGTTMTNGHQHYSNRHDQPTTTTGPQSLTT